MASDPEQRTSGERSPTAGGDDAPAGGQDSGRASATADRASPEVLRAFLYGFIGYVKARRLYPPGHERLSKQLESWLAATEAVFAHQREVSLFVQPDAIFVSGQKFGAEDRIAREFAPELVKRLFRYVAIERGIAAEELAALAEPLLLEPEELLQAGGARLLLAEAAHVFIIEFSYDMGTYVASEKDVEVVRTLARYESGAQPEEYVLRRFGEFGVSAEEKQRLGRLLRDPEVGSRLRSLAQLLSGLAPGGEAEVHTSDLVLYVVRSLTQVEQELNQEVTPERSARVFSHLVDWVQERLMVVLANPREAGRREVLSRVARQMMSSPEELIRWLAPESDRTGVTLSPDLAELLKAIFSRAETGRRRIRFGEGMLHVLEAPQEEPSGAPAPRAERAEDRPVDVPGLARRFAELQQGLGQRRFALDLEAVVPAHIDILLELLKHENEPTARERLLRELSTFVGQRLARADRGGPRLADRVLGEGAHIDAADLEVLLLGPQVCRQALREFLTGEARWESALARVAERHQVNFAAALGGLVVEAEVAYPLAPLRSFVSACQDELVDWLQRRLDDEEDPPPLDRVVSLTLACRTIRATPLVERLLREAEPTVRRALLRLLVQMEDARAISALSDQLTTGDRQTRQDILYLLGGSSQPLAEEALLAVATRSHWPGGRLEERLTALSSLARCGTERSLGPLRRLAGGWLLGLTAGGRRVREQAAGAVRALEGRLAAEQAEGEDEAGER